VLHGYINIGGQTVEEVKHFNTLDDETDRKTHKFMQIFKW